MSYQIMTDDQWVKYLKELGRGKSSYKNWFPYNLLYWDGERFSADCSNLEERFDQICKLFGRKYYLICR